MSARSLAGARKIGPIACAMLAATVGLLADTNVAQAGTKIPTTPQDYFQPGTPSMGAGLPEPLASVVVSSQCQACHGFYTEKDDPLKKAEPFRTWVSSMMGQSARDPLFYAGLAIANQDAEGAGEYCIRCHVPVAHIQGHTSPPDGTGLDEIDMQGVQCNFCHRMVDPVYNPGISPSEDEQILNDLSKAGLLPVDSNNSRFVFDPGDNRRGPFEYLEGGDYPYIPSNVHPAQPGDPPPPQPEIILSPFHQSSEFCWTCHGVSNVLMSRQPDNSYAINEFDQPHPTFQQFDEFPLHRTYNEWKNSYYSTIGVEHHGRFGGTHNENPEFLADGTAGVMKVCQDCHMPDQVGYGCNLQEPFAYQRYNVPQHSFVGANTWVINAVRTVDADGDSSPDHPDGVTGLNDDIVNEALARVTDFLGRASDLELSIESGQLKARLINRAGHKLPTGFPDGRRVWLNVAYLDCNDNLIEQRGAYDFKTAALTTEDTKVYEMKLGIDGAKYAAEVGHPEGETLHFILANKILKDNRIPPAGFSLFLSAQDQTQPVGANYVNGQHWDDTLYSIPAGARKAVTTVYYQVTSREFIEHLRDDNTTNNLGQVAYDLWVEHGMGAPVAIDMKEIAIFKPTDITQDGVVDVDDVLAVINDWGKCGFPPDFYCPTDINQDGIVDVDDLLAVINAWGSC